MEKRKGKEKLFPFGWALGILEALIIESVVAAHQIVFESLGRLVGQLDSLLEDAHGEDRRRHRGQPQPEFSIHRVLFILVRHFRNGLVDPLQVRHPAGRQVAVLKEHPLPFPQGQTNIFFCRLPLSLSQRPIQQIRLEAHPFCQILELLSWVRSRREDKDYRSQVV